jgi:hypothetical protein
LSNLIDFQYSQEKFRKQVQTKDIVEYRLIESFIFPSEITPEKTVLRKKQFGDILIVINRPA